MLDIYVVIVLTLVAFCTSVLSGAMGFMGGTILITVMAQFVPVAALIPLHGTVQLWSNGSRSFFLLKHVRWSLFLQFAIGLILGAALAAQFFTSLNEGIYNLALGLFIITITLVPKPKSGLVFPGKWPLVGFVCAFMGLYMGAVGTFLGAMFLSEPFEKKVLVATQAVCQTLTHLSKIIVFTYIGFQFFDWWMVLLFMLAATIAGSFVGVKILEKIPQAAFIKILKGIVVILAARLIYKGLVLLHFVG